MIKVKNNFIFSIAVFTTLVVTFGYAHVNAEETRDFEGENARKNMNGKVKELMLQKREQLQETREERLEKRCENINKLIDNRSNMLQKTHRFRQDQYKDMKQRLENLISRVENKGVDTSKLKADLEILQTKIQTVDTEFAALISLVNETKRADCSNTDGTFSVSVTKAKEQLQKVLEASKDVKEFFSTVIKPDLQAIRKAVEALDEESTN